MHYATTKMKTNGGMMMNISKIDELIKSNKTNVNTPDYWNYVYSKEGKRSSIVREDRRRWEVILNRIQDGDVVLDHGCGPGDFLEYAQKGKPNSKFYGLDHSKVAADMGTERGVSIALTFEDLAKYETEFDVITSQSVIEHKNNPVAYIEELKNHLKKDGLLIIGLPIADHDWHEHQMIWSMDDVQDLFNRFNCDVEVVSLPRRVNKGFQILAFVRFK